MTIGLKRCSPRRSNIYWRDNYHAHTRYGDGHSDAADYVREASERGMRCIGISEHAPLGEDKDWTMHPGSVDDYRSEVAEASAAAPPGLQVLCGLEVDWLPCRREWFERLNRSDWSYFIGSVHYVEGPGGTMSVDNTPHELESGVSQAFGGDFRAACDAFFACERAAALSGHFDILGHFDLIKKFNHHHRYFNPSETWYREMAYSVVDAAADVIVEVNTAGLDKPAAEFYPAPWLVQRCVEKNVRLTLNSDAHAAQELRRHFDRVIPELLQLGVNELWRLVEGKWSAARLIPA